LPPGKVKKDNMSKRTYAGDDAIATLALCPGKEYVETPAVKALSNRALSYLQAGFAVHLRGPAGSGKTTLAFKLASELARPVTFLAGDESIQTADLIGRQTRLRRRKVVDRFVHTVIKYEENIDQEWSDSRLTLACREGYTLIYDEFTRSRPEANNVLLGVLEERLLALPGGSGGGEYVPVHPDFRIIFTSNPKEYAGIHSSQDALNDRMITIDMDYFDESSEISITSVSSGLSPELATPVVQLVRAYRASGAYRQIPSPRASVMIAKMMVVHGIKPLANDPQFVQLCVDVLEGKCAYEGNGDAWAANREALRTFIMQHCGATPARQPVKQVQKDTPKAKRFVMTNGAMNGAAVLKPGRARI
jgi:nitric oxide reductase NorQ protein